MVLVDSNGENMHLVNYVNGVLERRSICRALENAPHVPIAGTSTVSTLNGELQVNMLFRQDTIALHTMGVCFWYPNLIPVRSQNPREVGAHFAERGLVLLGCREHSHG